MSNEANKPKLKTIQEVLKSDPYGYLQPLIREYGLELTELKEKYNDEILSWEEFDSRATVQERTLIQKLVKEFNND